MLLLLLTSAPTAIAAPVTSGYSHEIPVQGVGYGPRSMASHGFGRRAVATVPVTATGGASHEIPVQGVGYGPRSMALHGFGRRSLAVSPFYAGGGGPIVRRRKAPLPLLAARPRRDRDDDILLFIL